MQVPYGDVDVNIADMPANMRYIYGIFAINPKHNPLGEWEEYYCDALTYLYSRRVRSSVVALGVVGRRKLLRRWLRQVRQGLHTQEHD